MYVYVQISLNGMKIKAIETVSPFLKMSCLSGTSVLLMKNKQTDNYL